LADQQHVRHEPFQEPFEATKDATDRMTIDEMLAYLNDRRGSLQATDSVPRSSSTIQEQLLSSIEHQQVDRGPPKATIPTIEHHLASMIQTTRKPVLSVGLLKHQPSLLPSLEYLQS
jgi:hypothetical protein